MHCYNAFSYFQLLDNVNLLLDITIQYNKFYNEFIFNIEQDFYCDSWSYYDSWFLHISCT